MKLEVGQPAPIFTSNDQSNTTHDLTRYLGQWIFLYFYPKDDTPGCTIEACGIRDRYQEFKKNGVVVFGVSFDTQKSHASFATKYTLPFPLLSDPDKKIIKTYDVWGEKEFMGRHYMGTLRTSFLINPDGKIAKIYEGVKPKEHVQQVLDDIRTITSHPDKRGVGLVGPTPSETKGRGRVRTQ